MEEIWKDIIGFENRYQISSKGNVKNSITGKILKNQKSTNGYATVRLYKPWIEKKDVFKDYLVHRLVGEHFLPNPNNLPMINHIDENRFNPDSENLEWVDAKGNANHGKRNKTISIKGGIPICQYNLSGKLIRIWKNSRRVAKIIGLKLQTGASSVSGVIRDVARGKYIMAYGYMWKDYNGEVINNIKGAAYQHISIKSYKYFKRKMQIVKISDVDIDADDLYIIDDYLSKSAVDLLNEIINKINIEPTYMNVLAEIKRYIELS